MPLPKLSTSMRLLGNPFVINRYTKVASQSVCVYWETATAWSCFQKQEMIMTKLWDGIKMAAPVLGVAATVTGD